MGIDTCDQNCTNTPGSFLCNCSEGYVLGEDGYTCDGETKLCRIFLFKLTCLCLDIDECLVDGGGCDQDCNNTFGSFVCSCSEGYMLNEDGYSCDGERTLVSVDCCNLLLYLSDIDECLSDPCHSNATCNNTIGSFTCTCVNGYSGDGILCTGKFQFHYQKIVLSNSSKYIFTL